MQLSCFSKLAAFSDATQTKNGTSSGVWHWLTLSKQRDHSVGGQPLLQQQYYVKIPHFSVAIIVRVSDSQRCVSHLLQLQKQILQSMVIPGGGALSATFQAHQNLTSPRVCVICTSHVPVDDWPLSAAAVPKLQLPPHSNLLPSVPPPPSPALGPPNPDPAEGEDMDLSVCPVLPVSRTLTVDPLGLEGWERGAGSSVNARLDWDLGSSEARSEPWAICHVPRTIPEWIIAWQGGVWQYHGGTRDVL